MNNIDTTQCILVSNSYDYWKLRLKYVVENKYEFTDKNMKVILYLMENIFEDINQEDSYLFVSSSKDISDAINIARPTVINTMNLLEDFGLIERLKVGIWKINPPLIKLVLTAHIPLLISN